MHEIMKISIEMQNKEIIKSDVFMLVVQKLLNCTHSKTCLQLPNTEKLSSTPGIIIAKINVS